MYWVFEPNMLHQALNAYCEARGEELNDEERAWVRKEILDFLRSEQARAFGLSQGNDDRFKGKRV